MPTNYKQTDSRWAAYPYAGENMNSAGCGPTAVACVLDKVPTEIADWMTANGYASNGSGTYQSGITACIKAYGHSCEQLTGSSKAGIMSDSTFETFKSTIQSGYCGILLMGGTKTGCRNSYWSSAGHFIAVVGYSNGKYNVYDPAWAARDGYHDWSDFAGNIKHVYTTNIPWGATKKVGDGSCYSFSVEQIGSGANGNSTKLLQKILKGRGYDLAIDGSFGDKTYKAVLDAQKQLGISADGIVGCTTWSKLIPCEGADAANKAKRTFYLKEVSFGSEGAECYFLQNLLKGLGYYGGNLDLTFGGGCKKATIAFQKANGMAGDGDVGKNTWRKLIGF